jgi:hypothetical protein
MADIPEGERLERGQRTGRSLAEELEEIAKHCASLPVLDARSPEEILGRRAWLAPLMVIGGTMK